MVAKIVSGKNIRGVLNYNENKVKKAEAELLMACGFPRASGALSFKNKLERFELLTQQNERTKTNALHISLNFSRDDKVDKERLKQIALDYMEQIGFGSQPFLVYQHFDAAHPHIHIVTTNIATGGTRLETHNIGRNQSEKARKAIEDTYGLIRAEDQKKEVAFLLRPANLQKALYGKSETKVAISSIVRSVVASYKFASLPELNAILRQYHVVADRGVEDSKMYEKKGLVYRLMDVEGNKKGVPVKASSIYGKPTLPNLEAQFAPNKAARKPYSQRLRHILDKALASPTEQGFLKALEQQHIQILFRQNAEDRIYGVTFIDNGTCTVFNGSSLGKSYGAKAFLERMPGMQGPEDKTDRQPGQPGTGEIVPIFLPEAYREPGNRVIGTITDVLLESGVDLEDISLLTKRKKKKRQLSQS